jgi:competence protein ComEC
VLAALGFACGLLAEDGSVFAVLGAASLLRRRWKTGAACAFALAGALSAGDRTPAGIVEGEVIVEADVAGEEVDRLDLDLVGVAPIGRPMQTASGRATARGAFGSCGAGDRVRVFGVLRSRRADGFPGERARTPSAFVSVRHCARLRGGITPRTFTEPLRRRMRAAIDRALDGDPAALVRATAIGDRSGLSPELDRAFRDSGLSHVLAVSGLHLVVVAAVATRMLAFLLGLVAPIRERLGVRRLSAALALGLVAAYTSITGAAPSAVRSAIMISVLFAGEIMDRRREAWSALAAASLVMVALDPAVLATASFQLSFAAVASLLYAGPPVAVFLRRAPPGIGFIGEVACTTLAATIGTAPIVAHHFGRVSLVGLAANLPAVPLSSFVVLPMSLLGSIAGLGSDPIARPILMVAGMSAEVLASIARAAAGAPFATAPVAPIEAGLAALAAALLLGPKRRLAIVPAAVLAVLSSQGPPPVAGLRMTVLPVGQGSAALIETSSGRVLVDTGPPEAAERVLVPFLDHRSVDRIDLLVITHPHLDHTGGLEVLRRRVEIGAVWHNGDSRDAPPDLGGFDARVVTATAAAVVGDMVIEVLHADAGAATVNDGSIVLRVSHRGRRVLIAGDAEAGGEEAMIESGADLSADVLVVGHHGSRTSSTKPFLDRVRPMWAIISVGRHNRFRHPSPIVLDRLRAGGATVLRTDLDGAITIETDGEAIAVSPTLSPAPAPRLPSAPSDRSFPSRCAANPSAPRSPPGSCSGGASPRGATGARLRRTRPRVRRRGRGGSRAPREERGRRRPPRPPSPRAPRPRPRRARRGSRGT